MTARKHNPTKDNTLYWLFGGVAVVGLGVAVYLYTRPKELVSGGGGGGSGGGGGNAGGGGGGGGGAPAPDASAAPSALLPSTDTSRFVGPRWHRDQIGQWVYG